MKFLKVLSIVVLLLPATVFADGASIRVEVIVFQHLTQKGLHAETWPAYPALPTTQGAIELTETNKNYSLLSPEDFQLNDIEQKLQKNHYTILLHTAWLQPSTHAKSLHLYGKNLLDDNNDPDTLAPYNPLEQWQLNGTLKINKSNYYNVAADLALNLPINALKNYATPSELKQWFPDQSMINFALKQKARLRKDELHYFDHPLFGMLVKITPDTPA